MITADFQQGMESVSYFKMDTVTENYWLIYAVAKVIWPYHWVNLKPALQFQCPVDRDNIVPLTWQIHNEPHKMVAHHNINIFRATQLTFQTCVNTLNLIVALTPMYVWDTFGGFWVSVEKINRRLGRDWNPRPPAY